MTTDRVVQQLRARRVREGEFRAKCPVHGGKSDTSLSIKNAGDRCLVYCHHGCSLRDILAVLGLKSAAELFDSVRAKPNPEAERQVRIRRGLEIWCQKRFIIVCDFLRTVDVTINDIADSLRRYEDGALPRDADAEAEWWDLLRRAVTTRNDMELEYEILAGSDLQPKYELYRKSQVNEAPATIAVQDETDLERLAIQEETKLDKSDYIEFAPDFLAVDDPPIRYLVNELIPDQVLKAWVRRQRVQAANSTGEAGSRSVTAGLSS
jgi:hypothetical protein